VVTVNGKFLCIELIAISHYNRRVLNYRVQLDVCDGVRGAGSSVSVHLNSLVLWKGRGQRNGRLSRINLVCLTCELCDYVIWFFFHPLLIVPYVGLWLKNSN
jgi:hypothetical protein